MVSLIWVSIDSGNGLLSWRHQTITRTSRVISDIHFIHFGHFGGNVQDISQETMFEIEFRKLQLHLKGPKESSLILESSTLCFKYDWVS